MLNVFIIVLMDNFEANYINEENPLSDYLEQAEKFKQGWAKYCLYEDINLIK